jgi:hypothetical protein
MYQFKAMRESASTIGDVCQFIAICMEINYSAKEINNAWKAWGSGDAAAFHREAPKLAPCLVSCVFGGIATILRVSSFIHWTFLANNNQTTAFGKWLYTKKDLLVSFCACSLHRLIVTSRMAGQ